MDSLRQSHYTSSDGFELNRYDYCEDSVYSMASTTTTPGTRENLGVIFSTRESISTQGTHRESATFSNQPTCYGRTYNSSHGSVLSISNRETLAENAKGFITQINEKRAEDLRIMSEFRSAMELQANRFCDFLQQEIISSYENDAHRIQPLIIELFATFDRIRDIEVELLQFKEAFQVLFQQLQQDD